MNVTASITGRDELAVQIEVFRRRAKDFLLVVRVVDGRRQSGRDIGACERATSLNTIVRQVIRVRQRPQRGRAFLVGQADQFRRIIVSVRHAVRVGVGHARAAVGIVVADHDVTRPLLNVRQAVGIVIGIDHLWLTHHRHRRSAARVVIGVINLALWCDLLLQLIVHIKIVPRDRGPHSYRCD